MPLLPLRIVVVRPPPGVSFALQVGKSELLPPVLVSEEELVFEADVRLRVRPDGTPNLLGPVAHAPPPIGSSTSTPAPWPASAIPAGRGARR